MLGHRSAQPLIREHAWSGRSTLRRFISGDAGEEQRASRPWRCSSMDDTEEEHHMLMGQQLGTYAPSTHGNHWDTTLAAARACEQAGLDSVWLADHFMFPDQAHPEREVPVFDCFTVLGASAACHAPEFVAYGWPFPSVRERMEMLEEAVQIVDRMLTQRTTTFEGTHYTLAGAYNDPLPV